MVIDDEHGWTHKLIVPQASRARIVASTNYRDRERPDLHPASTAHGMFASCHWRSPPTTVASRSQAAAEIEVNLDVSAGRTTQHCRWTKQPETQKERGP
jgi:hypothetical protein